MTLTKPDSSSPTVVRDATCTFCGCLCDDIEVEAQGDRIIQAKNACEVGRAWFLNGPSDDRPDCLIEGKPASVTDGVERAARILLNARYPLVFGLRETTTEAQRVAVAIGDWIGGVVDTSTRFRSGSTGTSFQGVAEVACTLGEIAKRSDVLLFWGCNPAKSHPRHFERYSLEPQGMFLPGGRSDRTAILVDSRKTESAAAMDAFYQIQPDADFEALWILRGLVRGLELDARQVLATTGVDLSRWQDLTNRLQAARYGALLFDEGLGKTRAGHIHADAVQALVKDLNVHTRFVASPFRGGGNLMGADQVLTWQTGYPFGVNLSRGYPRFNLDEYSAEAVLSRGEADAALIVGSDPLTELGPLASAQLKSIPTIVCDFRQTATRLAATVAFNTATYGIHTPGTAYRMDGVPIPLRPALTSPHPSDSEVLLQLERRVNELRSAATIR